MSVPLPIAQRRVHNWNALVPEETDVKYFPFTTADEFRVTHTRSKAWLMCNQPCVMIAGVAGGVSLDALEIITK